MKTMKTMDAEIRKTVEEAVQTMLRDLFENNTLIKGLSEHIDHVRTLDLLYSFIINYANQQLKNNAGCPK